jgi:hypothetical protein
MVKYKLINPVIIGDVKHSFETNSVEDAAKDFWESFSNHISNNVPQFGFTLRGDKKDIYHFVVHETINGDYTINKVDIDVPKKELGKFMKASGKIKNKVLKDQSGGKHKKRYKDDDSSSSSSSDEEDYLTRIRIRNSPLSYFWYAPGLYKTYINSVFVPTFSRVSPYLDIWIPV